MTPTAIIALVRDVAIVGALAFIIWWIRTDGANSVKVSDMQAVQKQLDSNTKLVAQWSQEAHDAQTQRTQDMAQVSAAIAAHSAPIVVMRDRPASPVAVSSIAVSTGTQPAASGNPDPGPRSDPVDVRPAINAFELKYEGFLADCRAEHAQWPKVTP